MNIPISNNPAQNWGFPHTLIGTEGHRWKGLKSVKMIIHRWAWKFDHVNILSEFDRLYCDLTGYAKG